MTTMTLNDDRADVEKVRVPLLVIMFGFSSSSFPSVYAVSFSFFLLSFLFPHLVLHGGDDLGVAVPLVDGGVRAEEVKVSLAIDVPDERALAAIEHHCVL